MVSVPANLKAKGSLHSDVLTSKTDGHKRRGGVREGHSSPIHLVREKKSLPLIIAKVSYHDFKKTLKINGS